jgi:hypothetical protein
MRQAEGYQADAKDSTPDENHSRPCRTAHSQGCVNEQSRGECAEFYVDSGGDITVDRNPNTQVVRSLIKPRQPEMAKMT